jgi:hypothetical protein
MIRVALAFFAVAFALKIAWNVGLPYWLAVKACGGPGSGARGVSPMTALEVVLLLCMIVLVMGLDDGWPLTPKGVTLIGGAILVGSYLHLLVVGSILSRLVGMARRRRSDRK